VAQQPQSATPVFVKPKAGTGTTTGSAGLFDLRPIDDAIAQRGVRLIHMAAMPCPVGRISRDDSTRRSHPDHAGCQGGFIYRAVGQATCLFTSNSRSANFTDAGIADNDRVSCTMPRFYDEVDGMPSGTEVKAMPFDRLYLAEPNIAVVQWELAEWSGSGYDALKFPIVEVQALIDWQGNFYEQGKDFTVESGKIHWGQRSPGYNPETGSGAVYSVRYTYRPYYIVDAIGHEIRVANQLDLAGNKVIVPMPYQVQLVRENSRRNADNDPLSPAATSRQQLGDNQVDFANDVFTPTET
jgi:hypothetical protein